MAATSFSLIKIGDTYRLTYVSKNYTTGLTDVSAVTRDPSGTGGTISWTGNPATGFAEMGNGLYYHDWDSTSKAQGVWHFKINSTSKDAPATTRVQAVDGDTLNDTVFEKVDTMLDTIITNLGTMDGKLDGIDTVVDAIKADTTDSSTHSNAALKVMLDTINSTMNSLSNNSDAKIAIPEVLLIPDAGTNTFKMYVNVLNSKGEMEDPDDQDPGPNPAQVSIAVANSAGTDRGANLGGLSLSTWDSKKWMTRVSQGRYSATYAVANTHAVEELLFTFDYEEAGTAQVDKAVAVADVSESLNGTWYWLFTETKSYYIWYKVTDAGVPAVDPDPSIPSGGPGTKVGIEVDILENDTAGTVAGNTRTALAALTEKTITGSSADIIATNNAPYNLKNSIDGTTGTGFTITTPTEGSEGGYRLRDAATRTGASSDDYTSRFDSIDAALVTANGNIDDIEAIVDSASYGNAALKTLIDAIQGDIDDGTNGLAAIKSAVVSNYNELTNVTYGLSALKALIDTVTGYVDGVEADLTAIKGTGWASTDNLHEIADDVKPGGLAF